MSSYHRFLCWDKPLNGGYLQSQEDGFCQGRPLLPYDKKQPFSGQHSLRGSDPINIKIALSSNLLYKWKKQNIMINLISQWEAAQHPWFHCIHEVCQCALEVLPHSILNKSKNKLSFEWFCLTRWVLLQKKIATENK